MATDAGYDVLPGRGLAVPVLAGVVQAQVDPEKVAEARSRLLSAEDASRLVSLLAMMADPMRARILYALDTVDELCAGDLVLVLDASQDASATGLRILRTAGLVVNRRAGLVSGGGGSCRTVCAPRCEIGAQLASVGSS